jgi:hypothetical protein
MKRDGMDMVSVLRRSFENFHTRHWELCRDGALLS